MIKKEESKVVKLGEGDQATEVEIVVRQPPNSVVKLAERYKSKIWNQCIQDECLTKKELAVLMKRRGIWDDEKDEEEEEITKEIIRLERELYHGKTVKGKKVKPKVSEGRDIAIQIRKQRLLLRDLIAERINLEENTADNLADNARFDYLVAHCTFYKDGKNVYNSFEDYNSKSADEIAFAAAELLGRMLYNLDSSFEKNLPENKFLSKFNLVNDDLSLVDPTNPDQLIDTTGKHIDEDGYLLDDSGERVDQLGNKITDEGSYEMAAYDNDLVPKAKKPTRKKTTKESES